MPSRSILFKSNLPMKRKKTLMRMDTNLYQLIQPLTLSELPSKDPEPRMKDMAVQVNSEDFTEETFQPQLKETATQCNFLDYERCCDSSKFKLFTGLSKEDFETLYDFIGGDTCISRLKFNRKVDTPQRGKKTNTVELRLKLGSYKDRLFLFLLRLRRGLPLEELSVIAGMSVAHYGEVCFAMIRTIAEAFKGVIPMIFPSAAMQKAHKQPQMYPFKNLRLILDGLEIKLETPSNFQMQGNTYSKYKACNTMRFIVGISCSGATIYLSPACEGNMSEKEAVLRSGLLQRLDKGDLVMTDRGFSLTAELQAVGVSHVRPPSKLAGQPLTAEEEMLTKAIAPVRIYSEHAIAEIKDNRLLQGVVPLVLYPVLPDLVLIAAYLRNFSPMRVIAKPFRADNPNS